VLKEKGVYLVCGTPPILSLHPEIQTNKKLKIMDALFWIYIIAIVAGAAMEDYKKLKALEESENKNSAE
jgi:hypothetical protein